MKINKTNIAKVLRQSVFAPNEKRMKIIAEVGSYKYFVRRACELQQLALCSESQTDRQGHLQMAVSLLALAQLTDVSEEEPITADKPSHAPEQYGG